MLADIINPEFFNGFWDTEYVLWLMVAGAVAMLVYGANKAVGAAVKLAAALGISKVIIGATVVSLGTTSPEAAVSVNAAFKGDPGLALGNGVGSIICDTALIFGLCCCITRLPKDKFILNRHGWLQFGAGALLTVICLVLWAVSGSISAVSIGRGIGVGFLLLLGLYLFISVRWSRQHPQIISDETLVKMNKDHATIRTVGNLLILVIGLGLVVFGSEVLVGSVKVICKKHSVPEAVIAVTVVALGTSLPELVTAITSVVKGHAEIMVGNIIGADILNVLFVVGASATAAPLRVEPVFFYFLLPVMMLVLLLLRLFIFSPGDKFRRWQGIPLLAIYIAFVVISVVLLGVI